MHCVVKGQFRREEWFPLKMHAFVPLQAPIPRAVAPLDRNYNSWCWSVPSAYAGRWTPPFSFFLPLCALQAVGTRRLGAPTNGTAAVAHGDGVRWQRACVFREGLGASLSHVVLGRSPHGIG